MALAMGPSSFTMSQAAAASLFILSTLTMATYSPLTLTLINKCNFTLWPAIQPNPAHPLLQHGGFILHSLTHLSIPIPNTHWAGRVWARTACNYSTNDRLLCATGGCGGDRLECNGTGGYAPATVAHFNLHHGHTNFSAYGVSLVDGFNVPMTVKGNGPCPLVGCRHNLLATCPPPLQHRWPVGYGPVVSCKSGCEAFRTDELCCRNRYNSSHTCRASVYSEFFKRACPSSFTFAYDSPSVTHECYSPREIQVIFCH